jgi:hypothetical protein
MRLLPNEATPLRKRDGPNRFIQLITYTQALVLRSSAHRIRLFGFPSIKGGRERNKQKRGSEIKIDEKWCQK